MEELTFGQRLVYFRTKANLMQKELAEKIGVTPTALNYYEKDKREPNVITIKKLAQTLGITGDELIGTSSLNLAIIAQGEKEISLLHAFRSMNTKGQTKVLEYISDLALSGKHSQEEFN